MDVEVSLIVNGQNVHRCSECGELHASATKVASYSHPRTPHVELAWLHAKIDLDELEGKRGEEVGIYFADAAIAMGLRIEHFTKWADVGEVRSSVCFFGDLSRACREHPKAILRIDP